MTLLTRDRGMRTGQRESRHRRVIESCAGPGGRVVTGLARGWKSSRNVIG